MVTRYRVGTNRPTQRYTLNVSTISPIPKSYSNAFRDLNWYRAMLDEYNALIKNNTWVLVPRPSDANIVRSLWLFRHKHNADGSLNRYMARLIANDSTQIVGIDVDETFSPVVKPATIRMVLSLAISQHWPVHQLDVKNAFLHGSLSETVYMHQPPGFRDLRHPDHHGVHICYLLLYVDDIILTISSTALLQRIIASLHAEFSMTDLGPLNYFLGVSVTRNTSGMFLSQQKYATKVLERADGCKFLHDHNAKSGVASGSKLKDITNDDFVARNSSQPTNINQVAYEALSPLDPAYYTSPPYVGLIAAAPSYLSTQQLASPLVPPRFYYTAHSLPAQQPITVHLVSNDNTGMASAPPAQPVDASGQATSLPHAFTTETPHNPGAWNMEKGASPHLNSPDLASFYSVVPRVLSCLVPTPKDIALRVAPLSLMAHTPLTFSPDLVMSTCR
ncbi:ribonuclease H-like domain-containing protein [Tanacetum coccineum]|uniref:Ribonuclease H-like domain-containing protein n=1 Tax=Tanacetum coccineum TaxID=301880 RepID=A0ABQ5BAH9_9ASTR